MTTITSFTNQYSFLSNFYVPLIGIPMDGLTYPTVEHAYQAAKTHNQFERLAILDCLTPGKAKRMGRRIALRHDWESVKLQIMDELVYLKFYCNPSLVDLLLETGTAELIEGNTWGDTYWGVCDGRGENNLGTILMRVRENFQFGTLGRRQ